MVAAARALLAFVLVAAFPAWGCSSPLGSDEDDDAYVLATVPGTWQAAALGGTFVITLNVGPVDEATRKAPITGNGTFQGNQFTLSGTLGGKTQLGTQEMGIVKLEWTMPYQGMDRAFTFSGGLADLQYSSYAQITGTIATPGTSTGILFARR